jgi:hypothetical protein
MYSLNEKKVLDKKPFNDYKLKKLSINKIPKCNQILKKIPLPGGMHKNYKFKNIVLSKQPSAISLKSINYKAKKGSSGKNIPIIFTKNFKEKINESKTLNHTFKKRLYSSGKSKSEKKEDSTLNNRKDIKIDYLYNTKIEYYLLKEDINNILNKSINSENIDSKNKILKLMILKIKKILEKSNKFGNNDKKQETKKERNKKILSLCIGKYNKINKRLEEISNSNYITKLNNQIKEVKSKINIYENENKDLLLNNNKNIKIHNYNNTNNAITLPSLPIIKNELEINLDNQLKNRIIEYKNQIAQDILISKKIKNNEIIIKNLEKAIEKLNYRYKKLSYNYEKGIFIEEDALDEFKNINSNINTINNHKSCDKINMGNNPFEVEKNINFELNCLDNIKITKKRSNVNTLGNYSKFGDNILSFPTLPTKKKNLSYTNMNSNNNNKKEIKELILKNLDQKEKEEKTLINIHEENNNCSPNKFKFVKLKPNFSFNNDYYLFKDERINKFQKMQSSVENKSNLIENLYNNKNNEEIINESINIDESSEKYLCEKSDKKINNRDKKNIKTEFTEKEEEENNKINISNKSNKFNNFKIDNGENKNHLSITVKQREKALNTVMYDSLYE